MKYAIIPYRIFSLGDSALTIDFGNLIDEEVNKEVIARFNQLQKEPLAGMIELVPAYSTLTVYYDLLLLKRQVPPGITVFEWMRTKLEEKLKQEVNEKKTAERFVKIPVCYAQEFGTDIQELAAARKITIEEVINIHTSSLYKVYMLGFLPGFAYMGEVDEKITMPRKQQPQNVEAGSVGIAGKQTGIYPLSSPGGWQIIGRTPLKLFDTQKDEPVLLKAGDNVQFYSISKNEFENF